MQDMYEAPQKDRTGPSSAPGDLVRLTHRERRTIVAALETSMLNMGADGCVAARNLAAIVKKVRP
jgi:hypothetical protein